MISPSAVISAGAVIGKNVKIGAFSTIGMEVILKDNVEVGSHVIITGRTTLGNNCVVHPYAVIGGDPQAYKIENGMGTKSRIDEGCMLLVGDDCVIREHVTINVGSTLGERVTTIGSKCLILGGVHVGHDCKIGDEVLISNSSLLAGHVNIGSQAVVGGQVAIRQFVNVGRMAMIGGSSAVDRHVPPFSLVVGNRAVFREVNFVGLRRKRIPSNRIRVLQSAFEHVKHNPSHKITLKDKAEKLLNNASDDMVKELATFLLDKESSLYTWDYRQRKLGHALPGLRA